MCVAKRDMDEGTCIGCYPGSGTQWTSNPRPSSAFEDAYSIMLQDNRGQITPRQDDLNPLSRANDYRTNIADPDGPQGRSPNSKFVEIWHSGLPYAVFFTVSDVKKGEEMLWDYGASYWSDVQLRNFRCLPLQEQANTFQEAMDSISLSLKIEQLQSFICSESTRVMVAGVIWVSLMAMKQEMLAATWISGCALVYVIVLMRKHSTWQTTKA